MNPGTVLTERFEIVRALARGGMADVFVAKDLESGAPVAVKVLREDLSRNAEAIARFHREAEIATRLVSPHVAKIFDFGVTEKDFPYIVMELLEGHDLGTELKERAPLAPGQAASIVAQTCLALMEAHDAGIVHRDLKPTNLFLSGEGSKRQIKLLDFGIAKLRGKPTEELTRATAIFGSPVYMSPETFRAAKDADARSDVWSLGVILYEMLAGVPPFQGNDPLSVGLAVTREELPPLSRHVAGVPPLLQDIVSRTLMKDPDKRFQTMRELLSAIEPFVPRAPLDTPTREHVVATVSQPAAVEIAEADNHATLLKVPSIAPPVAPRSSVPPRLPPGSIPAPSVPPPSAAPPSAAPPSAAPRPSEPEAGERRSSSPPAMWKLGRPDERESDAANAALPSAPPPPQTGSIGALAKLALTGAVLGVAALAGWLAFVDVPDASSNAAAPGSAPAVQATGDSDQTASSDPPAPVAMLPTTTGTPLSADPVPLEDLPLAASSAKRATPIPFPRAPRSAKPGKRFNPTEL